MTLHLEVEQAHPLPLSGAFQCEPGELLALVGPSGAGKTSMLRVLAGLVRPHCGRVQVGDEVWCDTAAGIFVPPQQRHVGLVFQNYALMPHLSALDNVGLPLLHLPTAERQRQARRWLDQVRLSEAQQNRRPAGLSGGEQQRVAVARALAREPRVLLLDEPFSAVDQMNRQGLYRLLADLRRDMAIPIVLVTHDLHEAAMLADRLVVMDAGQVLQQGPPAAIHRAPRNARVADLVGIQNRFQGRWLGPCGQSGWGLLQWSAEATTAAPAGDVPPPPRLRVRDKGRIETGQSVHWVLTGDAVTLVDRPAQAGGEFAAVVTEARPLGDITLLALALQAVPGVVLRLTLSGPQRLRIEVGAALTVCLDLGLAHVMPVRGR
ncbi:MAG: ABC transporter ATP-binding protein [Betaproteobacteria bacterium]|nr:ABC transporter ATP-binding protein [Betaproteobacteria bacterium]